MTSAPEFKIFFQMSLAPYQVSGVGVTIERVMIGQLFGAVLALDRLGQHCADV